MTNTAAERTPVSLIAPAKLNLGLSILGKRDDGFHDLLSVFQTISFADAVALSPREDGISLDCDDPRVPDGEENLAWRAADSFRRTFDVSEGVHIDLRKRIPSGAGLGGGSSDAAAVLRGLKSMWGGEASDKEMHEIAEQLGSDVPFFLTGGTAVVEGRGERTTPLEITDTVFFVVVTPPVHVATGWAYSQLSRPFSSADDYRRRIEALRSRDIGLLEFCLELGNDFEAVVEKHHPEIATARRALSDSGASTALMTGSGSAVFGVFGSESRARAAVDQLPREMPGYFARTLSSREAT